jgi:16S rRNA (guanine527-N7)-methyltransferase|tara:strand:+ start:1251 stop:1898 length:648 start_codon:yes stop_codon:yes gene_type:complete
MNIPREIQILEENLGFTRDSTDKIFLFVKILLECNKKYNLISKNTEVDVWSRHVLDSAQIVKFIDFKDNYSLSDLGSGAGFPGIIIALYNSNIKFHVKLYEKSPVKSKFLLKVCEDLDIRAEIIAGIYQEHKLEDNYVVCRAFKKISKIIDISREKSRINRKFIILKGKNAQAEINNVSKSNLLKYKLEESITDKDSKIIILDANKAGDKNASGN